MKRIVTQSAPVIGQQALSARNIHVLKTPNAWSGKESGDATTQARFTHYIQLLILTDMMKCDYFKNDVCNYSATHCYINNSGIFHIRSY